MTHRDRSSCFKVLYGLRSSTGKLNSNSNSKRCTFASKGSSMYRYRLSMRSHQSTYSRGGGSSPPLLCPPYIHSGSLSHAYQLTVYLASQASSVSSVRAGGVGLMKMIHNGGVGLIPTRRLLVWIHTWRYKTCTTFLSGSLDS